MGCGRRGGRHQARVGRTARGLIFHSVRSANDGPHRPMSALGQKQTFAPQKVMSALPPKADMQLGMSAKGQKRTFGSVPLVMHLSHVPRTPLCA
jgi:hypothetical protein